MQKIRKGDDIKVIAGNYKGRIGKVLKVYPKTAQVLVEGVNLLSKFIKADPNKNIQPEIKKVLRPISISKVAFYDAVSGKHGRIGFRLMENGTKARYLKSTGQTIN